MNRFLRMLPPVITALTMFSSCSDFFENDLEGVVAVDGREIGNKRDAFYQFNGILQNMQQVCDNYVIAGELRGDMMTQTRNTSQDLRDIETFSADTANAFLNERKLYALINNCNSFLSVIDEDRLQTVADSLACQAKTIRAWAYMQLALDYGVVHYRTSPITSIDGDDETTDINNRYQLFQLLIEDLLPYCPKDGVEEKNVFATEAQYASVNSYPMETLGLPVRYILGELYMWQENFYEAAHMYYQLMLTRKMTVSNTYQNRWNNASCNSVSVRNWLSQFNTDFGATNQLGVIPFDSDYSINSKLTELTEEKYWLTVSADCKALFDSQDYNYNLAAAAEAGDLRGEGKTSDFGTYVTRQGDVGDENSTDTYITKYGKMVYSDCKYFSLSRSAKVYLRYAEAVNRLGLHNLAMMVLKYGLNHENMINVNYIGKDTERGYDSITDFGQRNMNLRAVFAPNKGIHARGCGEAENISSYRIDTASGSDSLTCVEDKIMDEYVLECAFEGGRFHDLMRISQYRRTPTYLAKKVAAKLARVNGDYEYWFTLLSDDANWLMPVSR